MKRHAPAAMRNRAAIAGVLAEVLPPAGLALEVASGTGQHAVHLARRFPALRWQPSDVEPAALESIAGWIADARREAGALDNIAAPVRLDATAADWPVASADVVLCINMIHISPWEACLGLLRGAGRVLGPGGVLFLYGPYRVHGRDTAPSNEAFDRSLRAQDPAWGLRYLDDVVEAARPHALALEQTWDMPANNLSVVLRKQ